MVFQPSKHTTHDHDDHDDRLRSMERTRMNRIFSRRAQKATTYRRVLVTPQPRHAVLGPQAA